MADKQTLEEMMFDIKIDLASVKNDITWLKRIFTCIILITGAVFGVDMAGVVA